MALALPKGSLILVTGATGYIGSWTTHEFISQGYRVRAGVRSQEKADLLSQVITKTFGPGHLEISIIPDFALPDAYSTAIKDVSAIVHIASDTSFSPDPNVVIPNAVNSIKGLLNLAKHTPSVKRIVLTSSSSAQAFHTPDKPLHYTAELYNEDALALAPTANNPLLTYAASKTAAEKEFWAYDLSGTGIVRNSVVPSFTRGPTVDDGLRSSTHSWLRGVYANNAADIELVKGFGQQWWVDVRDVARLHVAAAIFEEVKGQRLLGYATTYDWNQIIDFMRGLDGDRVLPEKVEVVKDITKADDREALKALKLLGRNQWVGWEESLRANLVD